MTLNVRFLLPAAMAVAVACATAGQGSSTSRDSRRITRDELDQLHEMGVRNLYEAIDRIRIFEICCSACLCAEEKWSVTAMRRFSGIKCCNCTR